MTPGRAEGLNARSLDRVLADKAVSLSELFSEPVSDPDSPPPFEDARRRLNAIHRTALTNREEKGIETCFAGIGLATWKVEHGTEPNAPVILLPIEVEATGAAARDFKIEVSGDAHLNPVLTHILRDEHDIDSEGDEADVAEDPPMDLEGFRTLLARLEESWSSLPDLSIEPRVVVAIFSYSTMPLVSDLEENGELFAESDIVAAIAGDASAREALTSRICDPDPNQPDIDPPKDEFLVLDADSSQHMAINRVLGGESLVIQGPPGTGKSQTIVNLVTALIARGKRVLFVAEKRAAIEAVTKRLDQVGLSDLVMDMHGRITSRRDFARTLADSLGHVATIPAHEYSRLHGRLQERRDSLIANDAALHEPREPWNLSVFHMQERLLAIPEAARTGPRLSSEAARKLDRDGFERLGEEIEEWIDLGGHMLPEEHPEWSRSSVTTSQQALEAFELVDDLAREHLPAAREALFSALDDAGVTHPGTVAEWEQVVTYLSGLERTLDRCHGDVYELDLLALQRDLARARGSVWARTTAQLFSKTYREARARVQATLRQANDFSAEDALDLVDEAAQQVEGWKSRSGSGIPRVPAGLGNAQERVAALGGGLEALADATALDGLKNRSYADLGEMLERLASNRTVVANLPRVRELEARFKEAGVASTLAEDTPPELAIRTVEYAWLRRVLDDLEFDDRRLSAFDSEGHSRHRDEFAEADLLHLESTPQRVHRLTAEAIITTMDLHQEETALVRREAAKKRRHLSVRQLFAQAPHVLTALRPCWTMSPVLAAEMIPLNRQLFDVVIFDEASQIPPAEAIGSLARASQAVVAGDSRQLPPTSFFGRDSVSDDDDDHDDVVAFTEDIESLLDASAALLRDKMLQWHYRSRDDRLIAFSNNCIYGGSLTAFPGAIVDSPISHCLVPFRPITGTTSTRSNPDEVQQVVDLVLEHARETPHETLGVIAFGQHHADNIENALLRRLGDMNDSSLDEFFSETNEERFFVKNIERVQGDERDVIILSVGYHKDGNGNLPYRFGPILQEGGERRLNVAVTRARSRVILVSSFSHRDMDPARSSAKGAELLRQYLEYAASGGTELGAGVSDVPLNPFELSIKEGLDRRGIPVTAQYGVSGYRIDFACAHPDEPGRMVLAVEADGASYHSSHTARDRDRLRQQVLEGKGWRFHRIWSTAWFRDREAELDKAEEAWKQAVAASDDDSSLAPSAATPQGLSGALQPASPKRAPSPGVPPKGSPGYDSIDNYSLRQLAQVARWIESDTLLRTEDDLLREMMEELGFKRSGKRITEALRRAIKAARSS